MKIKIMQTNDKTYPALSGKLVGFDCREKTLTFAMNEMPSTGMLGEYGLIFLPNETTLTPDYYPGMACQCSAMGEYECGCIGVDWSPIEIDEIQAIADFWRETSAHQVKAAQKLIDELKELRAKYDSLLTEKVS